MQRTRLFGCSFGIFGAVVAVALLTACGGAAPAPGSASSSSPATASAAAANSAAAKPSISPAASGSAPAAKPSAASSGGTASAAAKPAAAASGGTKVAITIASSASFLPMWVAQDAGIFAKNGLAVDFKTVAGGPAGTAALLSGDVQVADTGGAQALNSAVSGADLVVEAITNPNYNFYVEAPPSIKTLDDLKGKTIGVINAGSTDDLALRVGLKSANIDPDKDVHITSLGSLQAETAAMLAGAVDGGIVTPPDNLIVEDKGWHVVLDMTKASAKTANNCLFTTRAYATANHDVVQKVIDSTVQSIALIKKDKTTTEASLRKYLKQDDQRILDASYAFFGGSVFPALPYPNPDYFADAKTVLAKDVSQAASFDVSKITDQSFVQSAADRGLDKS